LEKITFGGRVLEGLQGKTMITAFREHARGIAAFFKLLREGKLKDLARIMEQGRSLGLFQVTKFESDEDVRLGRPCLVGEPFHNIFVNTGLAEVWKLITAQGGTAFSNANAYLGVGDSNAAPAVGQTDLQAAVNKLRVAMNVAYPNAPVNGLEQWQSDFTGAQANYSWQEFAVFNAAAAGVMMDRAISNQGTKTAGQTWRLTFSFTLS
jgi:hypothetical protein